MKAIVAGTLEIARYEAKKRGLEPKEWFYAGALEKVMGARVTDIILAHGWDNVRNHRRIIDELHSRVGRPEKPTPATPPSEP